MALESIIFTIMLEYFNSAALALDVVSLSTMKIAMNELEIS